MKGHILYNSIYMEILEKVNYRQKLDNWLPGAGKGEED